MLSDGKGEKVFWFKETDFLLACFYTNPKIDVQIKVAFELSLK